MGLKKRAEKDKFRGKGFETPFQLGEEREKERKDARVSREIKLNLVRREEIL